MFLITNFKNCTYQVRQPDRHLIRRHFLRIIIHILFVEINRKKHPYRVLPQPFLKGIITPLFTGFT